MKNYFKISNEKYQKIKILKNVLKNKSHSKNSKKKLKKLKN